MLFQYSFAFCVLSLRFMLLITAFCMQSTVRKAKQQTSKPAWRWLSSPVPQRRQRSQKRRPNRQRSAEHINLLRIGWLDNTQTNSANCKSRNAPAVMNCPRISVPPFFCPCFTDSSYHETRSAERGSRANDTFSRPKCEIRQPKPQQNPLDIFVKFIAFLWVQ